MGVDAEVFLAAGYAIFLVGVSLGLDALARRSHVRSEKYRTAGFTYHPAHDAWICPEDQLLTRQETDHERRLVRYRAKPLVCNNCPSKGECTDSHEGREISRAMDPWPHSEAGRFHRGISIVVASVPVVLLTAEAARNHAPAELAVLGATLSVVTLAIRRLYAAFRSTPANFPIAADLAPIRARAEAPRGGYRKAKVDGRGPTDTNA